MHFLIYNPPNATHKELFSWAEFQEYTIQAVMKTFQKTDVSMKVVQMDSIWQSAAGEGVTSEV